MKKLSIFLSTLLFVFILSSCGSSNQTEEGNGEEANTTNETVVEKTPTEMIVGSWYEEAAISGFDIVFMEDGNFFWHSGRDEGEDTWNVTDEGKLHMFGIDHEILELTETTLKVKGDGMESIYTRNVE